MEIGGSSNVRSADDNSAQILIVKVAGRDGKINNLGPQLVQLHRDKISADTLEFALAGKSLMVITRVS